jgi:hypothetical protein
VVDTIGYNLQIKHQKSRPATMPELNERHDTVIRGNLFAKEAAWPDRDARPNVLIGHEPLTGPGRDDRVLIYGNLFWQNPSEALFQGEGHLAIYNNLFVNSHGHAVHIQPHNDVPRQVDIFHNTILARGHGIRVLLREGAAPTWPRRVQRNLVFAARPIQGGQQSDNLSGDFDAAARYLKQPFTDLGQLDLGPRPALADAVPTGAKDLAAYPDSDRDFAGRPWLVSMPGACGGDTPCPRLSHAR